jgi:hypothetical protein
MKRDDQTPMEQLSEALLIEDSIEEHGKGRFVLVGRDGNAFSIMSRVQRALRTVGWTHRATDKVLSDMRSGDYNHLLRVAMGLQHEDMDRAESLAAEAMYLQQEVDELLQASEGHA